VSTHVDVALIGGGIMSATLGTLLKQLEPSWSIVVIEKLRGVALESSNPWNNAGTGHSALCELNYTPERPDGTIDISSAIKVNEQFQVSRQFWSHLVEVAALPDPASFINSTPHMSFVWGAENIVYLRKRFEAMKDHPLFAGLEYSEDREQIAEWAPLLVAGRDAGQPIAATYIAAGTDVDFGALSAYLFDHLTAEGAELRLGQRVTGLTQTGDSLWHLMVRDEIGGTRSDLTARFVFVGAGGNALNLLQKSGISEIRGFGGFPISGEFLRTDREDVVVQHRAKAYGKAAVGSPPMSVPHLDTRVVEGRASLMFGPYAGFSPKFLKTGSWLDLFKSIRPHNIVPMLQAGLGNLSLVGYLVGQLAASKKAKFASLQEFAPTAEPADWYKIIAGQRVQVIKKDAAGKGVLQFGTEVVAAADGTIAGLLGASPGASTAVPIMLNLVGKCFSDRMDAWTPRIKEMIPSYPGELGVDRSVTDSVMSSTARSLHLAS
jgi:malate dehydrogenase (quinone)